MAGRASSDGAKLAVLWWGLLAFVGSGFEHSVANMTVFSLAVFNHQAQWSDLARNLLYTVPGNVVGGAVLVGLVYSWLGRAGRPAGSVAGVTRLAGGRGGDDANEEGAPLGLRDDYSLSHR